jgi:integrase
LGKNDVYVKTGIHVEERIETPFVISILPGLDVNHFLVVCGRSPSNGVHDMPRKTRHLQWHKASSQWCKRYTDPQTGKSKLKYLGRGTSNKAGTGGILDELYDDALAQWQVIAASIEESTESHRRAERIELLTVLQQGANGPTHRQILTNEKSDIEAGLTIEEAESFTLKRVELIRLVQSGTPADLARIATISQGMIVHDERAERTIGSLVKEFCKWKISQAHSEQISVGRAVNVNIYAEQFRDWIGADSELHAITSERLRQYYEHLERQIPDELSSHAARDKYQVATQFVRWLVTIESLATLPSILHSRDYSFQLDEPTPEHMSPQQFRTLLEASSDRSRLFWLMMVNFGMTQKDISVLRPSDIDWDHGVISYRRAKLKRHRRNRQPQDYTIWKETLTLLKEFAETGGEAALLNQNNAPLVRRTLGADGRMTNINAITNAFNRVKAKLGNDFAAFSPSTIRNTGATLFRNSIHTDKVGMYLQHRDNSTDAHYAATYDDSLNEALEYLREELLGGELEQKRKVG